MTTIAQLIEVGSKHLPPSPSDLHLLDVGGVTGEALRHRRDVVVHVGSLRVADWDFREGSMDAIIGVDYPLQEDFLREALRVLRVGGRLILLQMVGTVDASIGQTLKASGFVRLLVEQATETGGLLIRGERAHVTDDTQVRVQTTAERDADAIDWGAYRGRYVHLLIKQMPNKPIWRLTADEVVTWQAVSVRDGDRTWLLGFSSLPKAVAFMQPAVMAGVLQGVNKVAKFSRETALGWDGFVLNPTLDSLGGSIVYTDIDPASAEQADE